MRRSLTASSQAFASSPVMPESAGAGGEALIRAQVHEGDGSKTTQLSGRRGYAQ
jgi:hypothetical protein